MPERDLDWFRGKLRIDKDDLDTEITKQPTLFFDVCDACAAALNERDGANERQKETKASLQKEAAAALDAEGTRFSIDKANAWIEQNKDYKKARARYKEAEAELARWEGMREAFRQRSSALRALAELARAQGYERSSYGDGTDTPERRRLAESRRSRKRSR